MEPELSSSALYTLQINNSTGLTVSRQQSYFYIRGKWYMVWRVKCHSKILQMFLHLKGWEKKKIKKKGHW